MEGGPFTQELFLLRFSNAFAHSYIIAYTNVATTAAIKKYNLKSFANTHFPLKKSCKACNFIELIIRL